MCKVVKFNKIYFSEIKNETLMKTLKLFMLYFYKACIRPFNFYLRSNL